MFVKLLTDVNGLYILWVSAEMAYNFLQHFGRLSYANRFQSETLTNTQKVINKKQ